MKIIRDIVFEAKSIDHKSSLEIRKEMDEINFVIDSEFTDFKNTQVK